MRIITQIIVQTWGSINGSEIKNTGDSSRGPGFFFHHPLGCSQWFITLVPGSDALFYPLRVPETQMAHGHPYRQYTNR